VHFGRVPQKDIEMLPLKYCVAQAELYQSTTGVDQKLLAMRTGCAYRRPLEEDQKLTEGQRTVLVDLIGLEPADLYQF
jgi:hypothetical protein